MKTVGNPKAMVEQVLDSPKCKEIKGTIDSMIKDNDGNAELAFRNKCIEMGIDPDQAASMLRGMFNK